MFVICYQDKETKANTWELVSGEDAMQIMVSKLCDDGANADDIMIFNTADEIK